jgi:hypothetical protein
MPAKQTVLQLVQSYCREYGLPVVGGLQGSSDAGALQLRELLLSVGENIWQHTNWQQCSRRAVWSSVGGTNLGTLDALFPDNFSHILPNSFWDYTKQTKFIGPLSDSEWQERLSFSGVSALPAFRASNNILQLDRPIGAGRNLSLIYQSASWITSASLPSAVFLSDADTCVFPDALMKAGLRAFWLRIKQMPHAAEFALFESMRAMEASRGTVRPILSMDGGTSSPFGLSVPLWR